MKQFLSFLLALTLTAALTGCGAQKTVSGALPATADTAASVQQTTAIPLTTAAPTTTPLPVAIDGDAQRLLEQLTAAYGFEGVISVMRDGKVICQQASGVADAQTGAPVTMDSLFCVGSLAKQFTAAAVLLLQERGMLRLDDTLGTYFPECPYGNDVTLRQMLHMRSGIAEFYETVPDDYSLNELPIGTLRGALTNSGTKEGNRALLQEWLFARPLSFTPDTETVYTNSNYFLLARLVEKLSGMAYEDFLRQNIFTPLHMSSTGFLDDMLTDPRLAQNAREAQTVYVGITMGLGDIVTNAADMQRWMTSFGGSQILSEESIAAMTADAGVGYGLGVVPDGDGWFHSGIFTSYQSFDYVNTRRGYSLFAVTNNQAAMTDGLSQLCFTLTQELLS